MTPTSRQAYVERLRLWVPGARREAEGLLDRWLADLHPEPLSGLQQPPALPLNLALAEGFLAREEGDEALAGSAARRLAGYGRFAEAYPRHLIPDRPEFAGGLPAQPNFFHLSTMAEAYLSIQASGAVTDDQHRAIRGMLAESCELLFAFPEWGAHNRTAIRAWGLLASARACGEDRRARRWERMARELMADSLEGWTIEDAMHYHAMWTQAVLAYVDLAGEEAAFFRQPTSRFYFEYYLNLLCPIGGVADFGDSYWASNLPKYLPIFERGAREYRDGCLRWAAGEVFGRLLERHGPGPFGDPVIWVQAANWLDEAIEPRVPTWRGREVLDELAGKKVVFRSGWSRRDTFLLLNYKPDTDYGCTQRDYLNHTIPVEAEKAHHGHADENSISTLTSRGALLLHDGGYREKLPNGQYRADLYHNRVVVRNELMREGDSLYEFLHNDGRYRPVETSRIDYRRFAHVEFSRTRVVDRGAGYLHDRVVAWLLDEEMFLVIDGIQALRDDVFTLSNLYQRRRCSTRGKATSTPPSIPCAPSRGGGVRGAGGRPRPGRDPAPSALVLAGPGAGPAPLAGGDPPPPDHLGPARRRKVGRFLLGPGAPRPRRGRGLHRRPHPRGRRRPPFRGRPGGRIRPRRDRRRGEARPGGGAAHGGRPPALHLVLGPHPLRLDRDRCPLRLGPAPGGVGLLRLHRGDAPRLRRLHALRGALVPVQPAVRRPEGEGQPLQVAGLGGGGRGAAGPGR